MQLKKLTVKESGIEFSIYPNGYRHFDNSLMVDLDGDSIRGIVDDSEIIGVAKLTYDLGAEIFQKVQLRDNTEYEFAIELPLSRDEYLENCEHNSLFPFSNHTLRDVVRFNGPDSCVEIQGDKYRVTGRVNFESRAGTAYLDIEIDPSAGITLPVEVLTQKLDYHEEFQELLHQISEYSASLLIKFDNATETIFGVTSEVEASPMAELMAFRRLFRNGRLSSYIREIINNPSRKMSSLVTKEDAAFVTNPDWAKLAQSAVEYDFRRGGVLKDSFAGYTPLNLPDMKVKTSFDTKDNRFVKSSLRLLRMRLDYLKLRMPKKYDASRAAMQKWGEELDALLFQPFWSEVGESEIFPNSMVMAARKGYREYFMLYLVFGLSIKLESEKSLLSVGGDIKPVFELYEIWCYLMIYDVLCSLTGSTGHPELSFASRDKEFLRDLIDKNDKPVTFIHTRKDKEVTLVLYYNRDFSKIDDSATQWADSYSGVFNPDISISIEMNDTSHWIHFDAKYRLDLSKFKTELKGGDPVSSFKQEDIHKMHTYRDAVLGTRGSYVLYPGREQIYQLFVRNPENSYRDKYCMPSVGAFPLKPTANDMQGEQVQCISSHIISCIDDLLEKDFAYKEEYGLQ